MSDKMTFISRLAPIVKAAVASRGWGIDAVATLIAWSAMESKWGSSGLVLEHNNLFGVKAGDTWKKLGRAYVTYETKEYQGTPQEETVVATFRSYASWEESVADLLHLLDVESVYHPARERLAAGDIQGFLQAIAASGYSTAKNYDQRIMGALDTIARTTA